MESWLLEVLACPACHTSLQVDEVAALVTCAGCGKVYPIRDGIPVLLIDEALTPGSASAP